MRLATLFSGIGAPEVAAKRLGWECLWGAEIESFPSAVLAHRHPESVNLGDVTAPDFCERALSHGKPDVLVFGSPCQSFSVAGKRAGVDDPRGVLAFVALGIVARIRPTWFVFENVPGLLSSNAGRDFGAFLRAVDECGYSGAWASPDAQFFGVPQRRERVFFIGHFGDWRYPAAVLSEFSRLCGYPPPRREKREDVAGSLRERAGGGCSTELDGHGAYIAKAVRTPTGGIDREDMHTLIAHSLRAEGFDASEDGTGRGIPLVAGCLSPGAHPGGFNGQDAYDDKLIVFDPNQVTSPGNYSNPKAGDPCHPLVSAAPPLMAFSCKDSGNDAGQVSPPLRAMGADKSHANTGGQVAVAFTISEESNGYAWEKDVYPTLNTMNGGKQQTGIRQSMSVRRLTPRECERLQGFEDGYTAIVYKNKPAADGPRYKAIGNSMCVDVLEDILGRIELMAAR
jgi:DNA (cytosine-5)-methyltransferase 1